MLGDEEQLATALRNLIANAINYSPDHTRVTDRRQPGRDDVVEISVADQGIGIPERDLERIFERFYRVDPARSRATGGTGLGLSIVKHVAANHGGEVARVELGGRRLDVHPAAAGAPRATWRVLGSPPTTARHARRPKRSHP